jgi:hypothetical protein
MALKKARRPGEGPEGTQREKNLELANDGLGKNETSVTIITRFCLSKFKKSENQALEALLFFASSALALYALLSPSPLFLMRQRQHRSIQSSPCIAVIPRELAHTVCCDASPTLHPLSPLAIVCPSLTAHMPSPILLILFSLFVAPHHHRPLTSIAPSSTHSPILQLQVQSTSTRFLDSPRKITG